jgi:hypothetical protein
MPQRHGTYEPGLTGKGALSKVRWYLEWTREKEKDGYILKFKARAGRPGFSEKRHRLLHHLRPYHRYQPACAAAYRSQGGPEIVT